MWDPWSEARASEELRRRLKWFLLGRLAVISCFLGMVAFSYLRSGDTYDVSANQLLLTIAATYAFSMVSAILLPHTKRLHLFTYVQVFFDVILITGVIYITGGIDSPFAFLYGLPIVNSAVLLFSGGALVTALFAALGYDGLLLALTAGVVSAASNPLPAQQLDPHIGLRLATTNLTFLLTALLAGILTRRLHTIEQLLLEREAERDYLALLRDTLATTIESGLITTDPNGRVTSIDQTAEQLGRCARAQVVGADIGTVLAPLRLTPTARLRFLQSSAPLEPIEFLHRTGDGEACHLRCAAAPLKNTYGHPIGALYVLQNISRLKELEEKTTSMPDLEELCRDDVGNGTGAAEVADGLHGVSPAIRQIREMIGRVAASDTTVLITGESGTGKEVVARAIHARSPRQEKRFVPINCGAIPEHLIESELFGHVRGAFTGAVSDRPGCFRAADGGSLFLDEIGELPLHMQVKLLRILQERVFRPVGSETNVAVDVRIIAASNRNLLDQVKARKFRDDLFYRLNVITIDLPPLRERCEDIPLLVRHFLRQFSDLHGRRVSRFSVTAGRALLQYRYPGNVRELENIVEHAVALCDCETATEEHLPPYVIDGQRAHPGPAVAAVGHPAPADWAPPPPPPRVGGNVDLEHDLAEYEKAILLRALDEAGGVKKRAAELLGINYRSLRHRLQKYSLSEAGEDPTVVQ